MLNTVKTREQRKENYDKVISFGMFLYAVRSSLSTSVLESRLVLLKAQCLFRPEKAMLRQERLPLWNAGWVYLQARQNFATVELSFKISS